MAAKNSKIARKSLFLAAGFYLTVGLLPLFIALSAVVLYPAGSPENPQMLLPDLVMKHSSLPLQIVFFGALLSAIMSTTSSSMLAPAALLTENIIKPLKTTSSWSEKQLLRILRVCLAGITLVSVLLAFWKTNIYSLIGEASMLLLVSLLVPLTAGLYWRKASPTGANGSLFAGMIAYLLFYSELVYMPVPHHLAALLISAAAMVAGSLAYPKTAHENVS